MTAEIKVLPGANRPDLVKVENGVEVALKGALDGGLIDVAVAGRTADGQIHVFGSAADADAAIGLLMRGAHFLAGGVQIHCDGDEPEIGA